MSGFLSGLLRAAVRGGRRAYEQSRREAEAAGQQRLAAAERKAQDLQQRLAAAQRKAQDLFARLDAGIEATESGCRCSGTGHPQAGVRGNRRDEWH